MVWAIAGGGGAAAPQWLSNTRRHASTAVAVALRSSGVGFEGSFAVGSEPNFIRLAISSRRAFCGRASLAVRRLTAPRQEVGYCEPSMPALRTTSPQRAISDFMKARRSSTLPGSSGSMPDLLICSFICG